MLITVLKLIFDLLLPKPEFRMSELQELEKFHNNEGKEWRKPCHSKENTGIFSFKKYYYPFLIFSVNELMRKLLV